MSTLNFNTEELVGRFEDRRDVKNLAGKYVMSLLLKKEPTILADLWSSRDDISLGVNGGYYAGREQRHHRNRHGRQDGQGLFLCIWPGDRYFPAGSHLQLGAGKLLL